MIQCMVIDDEPLAIGLLENYIEKTDFLNCKFSSTNPVEGLQKIAAEPFDLIFLDIQMPELNGMDFLKILGNRAEVILTTAYSEFALESYDFGVTDYLLKPISYERFLKSVERIRDKKLAKTTENLPTPEPAKDFFFVKSGGKKIRINFDEILFIEGLRNYINIKTEKEEIIVLGNLKSMENSLPKNFLRIHKSYIVNLEKISAIDGNRLSVGKNQISVGEGYRAEFLKWMGSSF